MCKFTKKAIVFLAALMLCGCAERSEELPEVIETTSSVSETTSVTEILSETSETETVASYTEVTTVTETVTTTVPRETTASRITKTSDDFITTPKNNNTSSVSATTEASSAVTEAVTVTTPKITEEAIFSTVPTMAETELTAPPETSAAAVQSADAPKSSDAEEITGSFASETEDKKENVRSVTYSEYFADSLFVGDSICSGLKVYSGLLDVENVAARLNVSTWGINKYTFQYKTNSTAELDAYSIVKLYQPEDIYIWMGMNDLYVVDSEKFAKNMCDLAIEFIKNSPESKVHIVSITPMASWHKWNVELDGNNRVNEYNAVCEETCSDQPYVDYINIHDCLIDSSGYLADENDGGDGMHLSSSAYKKVLKEIVKYNNDKIVSE